MFIDVECPLCEGDGCVVAHGKQVCCPSCSGTGTVGQHVAAPTTPAAPSGYDLIHLAREFAKDAHGDQRYGDRPYVAHLDAVEGLVAEAVASISETTQNIARCVAFLHDVVEDTPVRLEHVCECFGERIAELVGLVTDAPGASRSERKRATNAKLTLVEGEAELALIVKAADRLANVMACVVDDDRSRFAMYQREHEAFRFAVHRPGLCDLLWERLDLFMFVRSVKGGPRLAWLAVDAMREADGLPTLRRGW